MSRPLILVRWTVVGLLSAAAALRATPAPADAPAEAELASAYETLVQADVARDAGKAEAALAAYKAAMDRYLSIAKAHPDVQPGVVAFRVAYCDDQIEALLRATADPDTPPTPEPEGLVVSTNAAQAIREPAGPPDANAPALPAADALVEARLLLRSAEPEAARSLLLPALQADPDNPALRLLMGVAQCQAHNFDDAIHLLTGLVGDNPTNALAHTALGTAYFGAGRTEEALTEVRRALVLDPAMSEARYDLAQLLLTLQPPDLEGAREQYRQALALGAPPDKRLDFLLQDGPLARPAWLTGSVNPEAEQPHQQAEGAAAQTNAPAEPAAAH